MELKDRELQIQAIAREHHVKQLTEIEKKYHEAISQMHEAFDLVNKVEINGEWNEMCINMENIHEYHF